MANPVPPGATLVYDPTSNDPSSLINTHLAAIELNTAPNAGKTIAEGVINVVGNTAVSGVGHPYSLTSEIESIAQLNTSVLVNNATVPTTLGTGDVLSGALYYPSAYPIGSSYPNMDRPLLLTSPLDDGNQVSIADVVSAGLFTLSGGIGESYLSAISSTLNTISSRLNTIIGCLNFTPVTSLSSNDSGTTYAPTFANTATIAEIVYRGLYTDMCTKLSSSGVNSTIDVVGLPISSMLACPYASPANADGFYDAVTDLGADAHGYKALTTQDGPVQQSLINDDILTTNSLYSSGLTTASYDYISTSLAPIATDPVRGVNTIAIAAGNTVLKTIAID